MSSCTLISIKMIVLGWHIYIFKVKGGGAASAPVVLVDLSCLISTQNESMWINYLQEMELKMKICCLKCEEKVIEELRDVPGRNLYIYHHIIV
jgi:hypothetical protein